MRRAEIDTLEKVLLDVVSIKGPGILSNAGQLRGLLMDTVGSAPGTEKEIRIFFKFFNQKYLTMYQEAFSKDMSEAEKILSRIQYMLTGEEGMDRGLAERMTGSCMAVIRQYKGSGQIRSQECGSTGETAEGKYELGKRYYNGDGVELNYTKAAELFREAAAQGNVAALNGLGCCYCYGRGVEQDYGKAAECYRKAAKQGWVDALNGLGLCYYYGQGVEQDYGKAAKCYRKAAEQGNAVAQNNLGHCYETGRGVTQNGRMAEEWYRKAAEQGNTAAMNKLKNCYNNSRRVSNDNRKTAKKKRRSRRTRSIDINGKKIWNVFQMFLLVGAIGFSDIMDMSFVKSVVLCCIVMWVSMAIEEVVWGLKRRLFSQIIGQVLAIVIVIIIFSFI